MSGLAVSESRWSPYRWVRGDSAVVIVVMVVVGLFSAGAARPLMGVALVGFAGLALWSPIAAAAAIGCFLVLVPAGFYGLLPGAGDRPYDLYYIGGTQLKVTLIELAIAVVLLALALRRATRMQRVEATWFPVWPAAAFTTVFAFQLALALGRGEGLGAGLDYYSGRLFFNTLVAALLVIWLVRDAHREWLMQGLMLLLSLRAVYGLVRLVFFGGDPQNYYANFQYTGTAISFWDLADGAFLTLGALYAIGRLARSERSSILSAPAWTALAVVASALVAFTHRRSVVLGFGLALLAFLFLEGLWRRPGWVLVPAAAACVGVYGLAQRFATSSLLGILTADSMSPSGDLSGSRFLETASALVSVQHHPFLGLGLKGAYTPLPGFHPFAPTTIVHNSLLFLWMKLGIPGLAAVLWLLAAVAWRGWQAHTRRVQEPAWALFLHAWLASALVWLVDFVVGTPLIDHRHVLVLGAWLGMILVASRPHNTAASHVGH